MLWLQYTEISSLIFLIEVANDLAQQKVINYFSYFTPWALTKNEHQYTGAALQKPGRTDYAQSLLHLNAASISCAWILTNMVTYSGRKYAGSSYPYLSNPLCCLSGNWVLYTIWRLCDDMQECAAARQPCSCKADVQKRNINALAGFETMLQGLTFAGWKVGASRWGGGCDRFACNA